MNEQPYSVKQLAERWSCSESYICKLIFEEKLKAFHLGGTLKRITHQEVEQWESGQKNQPSGPTASDNTETFKALFEQYCADRASEGKNAAGRAGRRSATRSAISDPSTSHARSAVTIPRCAPRWAASPIRSMAS